MKYFLSCVLVLALPAVVGAVTLRNFTDLADYSIRIMNAGIGVVLVAAIVVYFYGVSTSINKMSIQDTDRLRAHFFWGILALFVMFSVWGILGLIRNSLFNGGGGLQSNPNTQQEQCSSIDCSFGTIET